MMHPEYGAIERQIRIDAPPQVVYRIISSPGHIATSWFDGADFELAARR
jgi:uncharacterized protein YndB with AHSA1/START domain